MIWWGIVAAIVVLVAWVVAEVARTWRSFSDAVGEVEAGELRGRLMTGIYMFAATFLIGVVLGAALSAAAHAGRPW